MKEYTYNYVGKSIEGDEVVLEMLLTQDGKIQLNVGYRAILITPEVLIDMKSLMDFVGRANV